MNDHEAQRIANAMHALRPDWPAASVLTLIRKNLIDRPRRDVTVALSWVACETNSHTPARVLEAGPWWRAAGIEGTTTKRDVVAREDRCSVCSLEESRCRGQWVMDHLFESMVDAAKRKAATADTASHITDLRAELAPTSGPTQLRSPEDFAEANPELHARVQALRDANPGLVPPPMREEDPA